MAWNKKESKRLAKRVMADHKEMLDLIDKNRTNNPVYIQSLLGVEVAQMVYESQIEIYSIIGDSESDIDLGYTQRVERWQAVRETVFALKKELNRSSFGDAFLSTRAFQKGAKSFLNIVDSEVGIQLENLTLKMHRMDASSTEHTKLEKKLLARGAEQDKKKAEAQSKFENEEMSQAIDDFIEETSYIKEYLDTEGVADGEKRAQMGELHANMLSELYDVATESLDMYWGDDEDNSQADVDQRKKLVMDSMQEAKKRMTAAGYDPSLSSGQEYTEALKEVTSWSEIEELNEIADKLSSGEVLTLSQLASMSDTALSKKGMYRVPGYTKSDGTKVKTHFRKRPTSMA